MIRQIGVGLRGVGGVAAGRRLGPELLANGGFDDDTGWTTTGSGWAIAAGMATHAPGGDGHLVATDVALIVGKTYRLSYSIVGSASEGAIQWDVGGGLGGVPNLDGPYVEIITATSNTVLRCYSGPTFDGSIDDVSLRAF